MDLGGGKAKNRAPQIEKLHRKLIFKSKSNPRLKMKLRKHLKNNNSA